jgi:hypothetical protein
MGAEEASLSIMVRKENSRPERLPSHSTIVRVALLWLLDFHRQYRYLNDELIRLEIIGYL